MLQEALTDPLYLFLLAFHGLVVPFTKVEESFNLHAIHDFIYYSPLKDLAKFDHMTFPGAVPRSFIPGFIIGMIVKMIQKFAHFTTKVESLFVIRATIGLMNWLGWVYLRESLKKELKRADIREEKELSVKEKLKRGATLASSKGKSKKQQPVPVVKRDTTDGSTSSDSHWSLTFWFFLISGSQFHLVYYSTRTLPNFLALPLTNFAFGKLFRGEFETAILILSFIAVILRIEIVALVLSLGFVCYFYKKLTIQQLVRAGLKGALVGILLSGVVDSYFWQRFTVPEIESFIFNVIYGKSSEWGVSPWYEYFTRAAFKLFIIPYVPLLALVCTFKDPTSNKTIKISLLSSLLFVTILSFQGHKEWRFIAYVIPLINISAATQCSTFTSRAFRTRWNWYKPLISLIIGCSFVTLILTTFWLEVSYFNYPAGQIMISTQEKIVSSFNNGEIPQHYGTKGADVIIHTDTYVNGNGASLLTDITGLLPPFISVKLDKTEDPAELSQMWDEFDYLVTENPSSKQLPIALGFKWEQTSTGKAFVGIDRKGIDGKSWIQMVLRMWERKTPIPMYIEVLKLMKIEDKVFVYKKVPLA